MARQSPKSGEFGTIKQCAIELGIGEKCLRAAAKRNEFAVYRPPAGWPRLRLSEVRAWVAAQRVQVAEPDVAAAAEKRIDEIEERAARGARPSAGG